MQSSLLSEVIKNSIQALNYWQLIC